MSEIPLYPDECDHRRKPERCWECLSIQNCIVEDALRVEKARVAELEAALREVLDMQCHAPAESETHCARGASGCAVCRVWPYLRGERR